jgi:hypothetical protein
MDWCIRNSATGAYAGHSFGNSIAVPDAILPPPSMESCSRRCATSCIHAVVIVTFANVTSGTVNLPRENFNNFDPLLLSCWNLWHMCKTFHYL